MPSSTDVTCTILRLSKEFQEKVARAIPDKKDVLAAMRKGGIYCVENALRETRKTALLREMLKILAGQTAGISPSTKKKRKRE